MKKRITITITGLIAARYGGSISGWRDESGFDTVEEARESFSEDLDGELECAIEDLVNDRMMDSYLEARRVQVEISDD